MVERGSNPGDGGERAPGGGHTDAVLRNGTLETSTGFLTDAIPTHLIKFNNKF